MASHVSTSMAAFRPLPGDVYLALEPRHLRAAAEFLRNAGGQSTLLGMWCTPPLPYLPDPYGQPAECFQYVFGRIEAALDNIRGRTAGRS